MSTLCLTAGKDSFAMGYCCVAVGDGAKACGGFQVVTKEPLTLPDFSELASKNGLAISVVAASYLNNTQYLLNAYKAMSETGNAPKEFGEKAEKAAQPLLVQLKEVYEKESKKEKEAKEETEEKTPQDV